MLSIKSSRISRECHFSVTTETLSRVSIFIKNRNLQSKFSCQISELIYFWFDMFITSYIIWFKWLWNIWILIITIQFSSVTQLCPTLCDPMSRSTPGLPVHHELPKSTRTHVHCVGDAIQPSHPGDLALGEWSHHRDYLGHEDLFVQFCEFLISSASVRSIPFLSFIEPIFAWNFPLLSLIFLKRSLVFPILLLATLMIPKSLFLLCSYGTIMLSIYHLDGQRLLLAKICHHIWVFNLNIWWLSTW